MSKTVSFWYKIDPLWDAVKQIRDRVELSLMEYDEEVRDASKMTASELIENAVKYGSSVEKGAGIKFDFIASNNQIKIMETNKIHTDDDYEALRVHIENIMASDNPQELYLQRLQMLMDDTRLIKTQLGLFRIAYEGEFTLSYEYKNNVVTVIATREIEMAKDDTE